MNENSAPDQHDDPTPIFGAYRRGYDPEKVDRYVAEQRQRLDETLHRANEAERRLAAAVGQLRELHRRVAVLESEERAPQPPSIDTLGERVQRILQEAWDGAYALRQSAEQEVAGLRDKSALEAEEIVETAKKRAEAIEEETERRRQAYFERIEVERSKAVDQMTYLQEQRQLAIAELLRVKSLVEATVGEITGSRDSSNDEPLSSTETLDIKLDSSGESGLFTARENISPGEDFDEEDVEGTMTVAHLSQEDSEQEIRDASALVRDHRATRIASGDSVEPGVTDRRIAKVFDFESEQS